MDSIYPEHTDFHVLDHVDTISAWTECAKQIYNEKDVASFQRSQALENIRGCLFKICSMVQGCSVPTGVLDDVLVAFEHGGDAADVKSTAQPASRPSAPARTPLAPPAPPTDGPPTVGPAVEALLRFLASIRAMVQSNPPLPGPRRYGNMACRSWHDELRARVDALLDQHLYPLCRYGNFAGLRRELKHYILNAFGSRERLDYGTGHELSFLAFVNALIMARVVPGDSVTGEEFLVVFGTYYDMVKEMILTYSLEPAGSHGVWGLDDHFHLVYILGSAQLAGADHRHRQTVPSPSAVLNAVTLHKYRTSNLYFNAISFIRRVKSGPFHEHSPVLYDVSAVKTWRKVNQGMIKMWFVEVLAKFPVVQHFYFGGVLYPWCDAQGRPLPQSSEFGAKRDAKRDEAPVAVAAAAPVAPTVPTTVPTTRVPWGNAASAATPAARRPGGDRANAHRDDSVVTRAPWAR